MTKLIDADGVVVVVNAIVVAYCCVVAVAAVDGRYYDCVQCL